MNRTIAANTANPTDVDALLKKKLGPGCDVWIVSSPEKSSWARKLDWYLNFQIMKAADHRPRSLAPALIKIAEETEFEISQFNEQLGGQVLGPQPLMIASRNLLPNTKTIVIPVPDDVQTWAKSCTGVCRNLISNTEVVRAKSRVRVFLPDSVTAEEFMAVWSLEDENLPELELVSHDHE